MSTVRPGFRFPSLADTPGVIAIVSSDRVTYEQFAMSLCGLKKPLGSGILWETAGPGGVAEARNRCVRVALEKEGAHWVWFLDDDHVFDPTTLNRLLKCNVDMVQPLVVMRNPPHAPVLFSHFEVRPDMSDEGLLLAYVRNNLRGSRLMTLTPGQRGLVETGHAGTGGLLIRMEVFRVLADPWFQFGRIDKGAGGEDTWFTLCARRAGFRCYCDLDTPLGHLTTTCLWPTPADAAGKIGAESDARIDNETIARHLR